MRAFAVILVLVTLVASWGQSPTLRHVGSLEALYRCCALEVERFRENVRGATGPTQRFPLPERTEHLLAYAHERSNARVVSLPDGHLYYRHTMWIHRSVRAKMQELVTSPQSYQHVSVALPPGDFFAHVTLSWTHEGEESLALLDMDRGVVWLEGPYVSSHHLLHDVFYDQIHALLVRHGEAGFKKIQSALFRERGASALWWRGEWLCFHRWSFSRVHARYVECLE